jgi:periplasmic divalent cation tolerance protein
MPTTNAKIVLTTSGDEQEARSIARRLVDDRLAACVNVVGPIRSVYRWRSAVEDDSEYLLIIKTRANLLARVERRIAELHSYEVPEVLVISPSGGSVAYLGWLAQATAPGPGPAKTAARRARARG